MKKKINYWWLLILLTIVPYFYFIYMGITHDSGIWAVYSKLLAPAIAGATVIAYIIQFIVRKTK